MIERAVVIGRPDSMIGILTEPASASLAAGLPAIVLLNAGLLHRVGPNRTYVDIARSLAASGYLTLRVDLCGLGDSDARRDRLSFEEAAVDDTRRAMDYLGEARGSRSFIIGGLCSGADNAFRVAALDSRVSGAILMDWYAYRTVQFYLRHYAPRLFQGRVWRNKIVSAVHALRGRSLRPPGEVQLDPFGRPFPPRSEILGQLRGVLRRGVQLLCVYTAGQLEVYNYRRQFHDMFGLRESDGQVRIEFLRASDHTFSLTRHQAHLRETITEWVTSVDWTRVGNQGNRAP